MLTIVFNYKKTNSYALSVIGGALEGDPALADVELVFAEGFDAVIREARGARERQRHVVVAWSFYSPQFPENYAELRAIKAQIADDRVIHLAGGVHATAEPAHTLRGGFDFVSVGEGEKTILEFARRILSGGDLRSIKGIACLDGEKFVSNGSGERIDLNAFPPFAAKHYKFNPIEITRGCIYACKFCQTPIMFKARFRHRSIENVCEHVRVMKASRIRDYRFITPTCMSYGSEDESVKLDVVENLLASVREIVGDSRRMFFGTFPSELRPEHVTLEALRMIKKYVNNDNIIIGAQSGSQKILDHSKRGHGVDEIISAARITLEAGFRPNVDFIFGLPEETPEDVEASLHLAEQLGELGAKIHAHTFMPLPGTPFKNERPGSISEATARRLKRLSSRGGLYGQWQSQVEIARELAGIRRG